MNKSTLLATTAVGLYLCLAPASAQMKEEKSTPGATSQPSEKMSEPKEKATKGAAEKAPEPKDKATKGTAEKAPDEPKGKATKGSAEKAPEPKDKATKGTAEKAPEPKDKATKGTAEKAPEPKDKATTKGTAEKAPEPKDKATQGAGTEPRDKTGSGSRVQLTEEKRTNVGQTLSKDGNLNRATNVNVSVNIGTRLPRSVRLVALPASIISIVPEYRSYHYVVVEDRICIVEPSSYEVVEVIPISGQTASRGGPAATLVLTDEERSIILAEVDMGGGSTMGLGALSEGAEVPRDAKVRTFSETIVQKVPKVKGYKFFTAENRVAIVDPQGTKVQLILENRR